jgi:hypothetical protein
VWEAKFYRPVPAGTRAKESPPGEASELSQDPASPRSLNCSTYESRARGTLWIRNCDVDILTAALLGLGGLFTASMGKLLSNEIDTCLPLITKWLLERAVLRLPPDEREAFAKRVVRRIRSWPGRLGRFCMAVWLLWESRALLNLSHSRGNSHYMRRSRQSAYRGLVLNLISIILASGIWIALPDISDHFPFLLHFMTMTLATMGVTIGLLGLLPALVQLQLTLEFSREPEK